VEIVGRGFLARNLERLAGAHPDVVVIAAGVSSTSCVDDAEFQREAQLVYRTIRRCLRDGRRLLLFSSASAAMYASPGCPGREDGPVFPSSMYGRHKLAMERALELSGVDYLVLRLTHIIGAHQRIHQLLPGLVAQLLFGEVTVHRGAHRDLVAADDFVAIVDALLANGIRRTVVNVGCGAAASAEDIVGHLQDRLGVSATWHCVDRPSHYPVDISRLTGLVPAVADMGFGQDYFRRVLDRYVDLYRISPVPTSSLEDA
jgi:nucleoside-diphosphate-sugar epimerase